MIFGKGAAQEIKLTFVSRAIEKTKTHQIPKIIEKKKGSAAAWLQRMAKTWKQGTALIRRIAHRLRGAEVAVARTLTQALLISKVMYGIRFYHLDKTAINKIEKLLNDARRCIAGLPQNTKLEELRKRVNFPDSKEQRRQQE